MRRALGTCSVTPPSHFVGWDRDRLRAVSATLKDRTGIGGDNRYEDSGSGREPRIGWQPSGGSRSATVGAWMSVSAWSSAHVEPP